MVLSVVIAISCVLSSKVLNFVYNTYYKISDDLLVTYRKLSKGILLSIFIRFIAYTMPKLILAGCIIKLSS